MVWLAASAASGDLRSYTRRVRSPSVIVAFAVASLACSVPIEPNTPAAPPDRPPAAAASPSGAVVPVPLGPLPLATASAIGAVPSPRGIAVDATSAYVTSFGDPGIFRIPKAGGAATKIATASWPTYVAVDSTHVYWTDLAKSDADANVARVPVDGGSVQVLAAGLHGPNSATLDGPRIFFAESGRVASVPRAGGAVVTFASSAAPYYVATNATTVCWADRGNGRIDCEPSSGGSTFTLIADDGILALGLSDGAAYWLNGAGELRTIALVVGPARTLAREVAGALAAELRVEKSGVYWAWGHRTEGAVRRLAGSTVTTYASGENAMAMGVAVDDTHVYWTAVKEALIRRAPQ